MSFPATCHLSGLIIKEDETVVCLPVSYSTVKHTTQLVYAQNNECNAIGLPLIGKYNGYGSVQNIDKQSVSYLLFQDLISSYSIDNDKKPKKFPRMKFCAFKNEYNRAAHGEFINDDEIKVLLQQSEFYPLADIDVEAFLDLCHSRAIFDVSSNSVSRIGFILVKKSIFDKMCQSYVSNELKDHKEKILSFCEQKSEYANSKVDLDRKSVV